MWREYAPVRNVISINVGMAHIDIDEIDVINIISLIRFNEGGAAILADANINHHSDMMGVADSRPFIRYILRVWVSSYVRLAKENRAEEDSPWAIIINVAPINPH